MRKVKPVVFLVVSVVIFLIGGAYGVTRTNEIEEVMVTVQGKGSLRMTPDLALLNMGVEVTAPTAQEAVQENSRIMQAVLDTLFSFNIPKDEIKTTWFSLWRETEYREGKQVFKGFRVSHTLEVPVTDIARTGEILDAAVSAGVNIVNNVTFSLRDIKEAYRMALLKAMENAHYKARLLAEAEELEVKQIKRVTEKQVYGPLYGAEGEGGEFTMAPFVPGQLKIEATVEVTFSLWRSS